MSRYQADADHESTPTQDFVSAAATVGVIAAGVALLEVALIPGMVIGGAAVLAPKLLRKKVLPNVLQPLFGSTVRRRAEPAASARQRPDVQAQVAAPASLGIKQAVAKTITFRIIVTTLDFTSNYVVLGELATAAGLSAFALVAGPVFYLAHETAWNYFGPAGNAVDLPGLPRWGDADSPSAGATFTVSRALAKTITFRTIATTMDFTATYLVVGDVATAVGLSAFGFVVGPFVYFGHERAWDYFSAPRGSARGSASDRGRERTPALPAPTGLLPVPG